MYFMVSAMYVPSLDDLEQQQLRQHWWNLFTRGQTVLRLLYRCASPLIMCTLITSHTLLPC